MQPLIAILAALLVGQDVAHEFGPIRYESTPPRDAVALLDAPLTYQPGAQGYLQSALKALNIPASSQVLVFSRTSMQGEHIHPDHPRAIYFNDDSYVAWVPGAPLLEIASFDPMQGAMFYTVEQKPLASPLRTNFDCLQCHVTEQTQGVAGVMVRSVQTDGDGEPIISSRQLTTDHRSPIADRWAGWYVTAKHGNIGQGRSTDHLDTSRYLTPHSDIVALMVLEHQTQMHNLIIRAGWHTRMALDRRGAVGEDGTLSARALQRIERAGEPLVRYMLFADEAQLTHRVEGTSTFAADFASRGKRDGQGRSLRDFDLNTRLFKYRCSYLIDSPSFEQLPEAMKDYVLLRLDDILSGRDKSETFKHLDAAERRAIRDILNDTL